MKINLSFKDPDIVEDSLYDVEKKLRAFLSEELGTLSEKELSLIVESRKNEIRKKLNS